jgi:hypothetical protein
MSNYIKNLPEDARQVKNAMNWVDRAGNLYGVETRMIPNRYTGIKAEHKHYGEFFKYNTFTNNHNGYVYGNIKYIKDDGTFYTKQRRLHIVIAETFLENPDNLPIVGHKNNIKTDNRVENLYWTTWQENTQKAVDDRLLVNDKGYDDSQSNPVVMFDTYNNKILGEYGSAREASHVTGISLTTILRQAKYKRPVRKPFYFRFQDDESVEKPIVVVQYDFKTNKEIARFWNTEEASRQTGICNKVIATQCKNGKKPKWTKSGFYFLYSK